MKKKLVKFCLSSSARSGSGTKPYKLNLTNLLPTPPTPQQRRIELSRTAKITIKDDNATAEVKEFVISFDDLEQGDLLGRGQFGTVKKMHHKASNLTFAVKVSFKNYWKYCVTPSFQVFMSKDD
jgi:hypothetical protein